MALVIKIIRAVLSETTSELKIPAKLDCFPADSTINSTMLWTSFGMKDERLLFNRGSFLMSEAADFNATSIEGGVSSGFRLTTALWLILEKMETFLAMDFNWFNETIETDEGIMSREHEG